MELGKDQQALAQQAGRPNAHKINRCLMLVYALPFFRPRHRFGRARNSQLATTCFPPLPPASMCFAHDHVNAYNTDAMGQRAPASYVSLAARHGQCGQAQKANSIRGSADVFSLLCELASDQRQPTRRPPGYLFSFLCLALLPHFSLLKLLYFDFQLLRKYLLSFH